jgi:hypothetical protein
LGVFSQQFTAPVEPHSVVVLKLTPPPALEGEEEDVSNEKQKVASFLNWS